MKAFDNEKFCMDLIAARKNSTQTKVATELGINRSTLSLLESRKQIPSLEILNKVCSLCNTTPNSYFNEKENDGILFLMGHLEERDKDEVNNLLDRIKLKEKYAILSRRSS